MLARLAQALLPDTDRLRLDEKQFGDNAILLQISAVGGSATCPVCNTPSRRVHSHYQRKPRDLPRVASCVRWQLTVRCPDTPTGDEARRPYTRVVCIFPIEASGLRLVGALLLEQDEEWMTGRIYLSPTSSVPM